MQVYLINRSSKAHGITDAEARRIASALNHQCQHDLAQHWRRDVHVQYATALTAVPENASVLFIVDRLHDLWSDVPANNAFIVGEHRFDSLGGGRPKVPYAAVGVQDAAAVTGNSSGVWKVSEFCSHELLEMVVDPLGQFWALSYAFIAPNVHPHRLHPLEVGDACQLAGYDVVLASGDHVRVSDFVLPAWFDSRTADDHQTDFCGHLHGPFSVTYYGYENFLDLTGVTPYNGDTIPYLVGPQGPGYARAPGAETAEIAQPAQPGTRRTSGPKPSPEAAD